jgi:hypothetical protein
MRKLNVNVVLVIAFCILASSCSITREQRLSQEEWNSISEAHVSEINELYQLYSPTDSRLSGYQMQLTSLEQELRDPSGIAPIIKSWQVIRTDKPEAFADLAGNVYVSEGLVSNQTPEYRKNDLAAVIAHEMAHVLRDHLKKRFEASARRYRVDIRFTYTHTPIDYDAVINQGSQLLYNAIDPKGYQKYAKFLAQGFSSPSTSRTFDTTSKRRDISASGPEIQTPLLGGYSLQDEMDADLTACGILSAAGFSKELLIGLLRRVAAPIKSYGTNDPDIDKRIFALTTTEKCL